MSVTNSIGYSKMKPGYRPNLQLDKVSFKKSNRNGYPVIEGLKIPVMLLVRMVSICFSCNYRLWFLKN